MANGYELAGERNNARRLTRLFNSSTEEQMEYRTQLLKELFESAGDNIFIEPVFQCDYGSNISVGENFYANFGCVILDVCKVKIGKNVMLGPGVAIFTAGHPVDAEVRNTMLEFGAPVTIGDNVWIGGNAVINPGVSIGNNAVIGAGAVVTKDIPADSIAAGVPCKVLRKISATDKAYWEKQREEYIRNK